MVGSAGEGVKSEETGNPRSPPPPESLVLSAFEGAVVVEIGSVVRTTEGLSVGTEVGMWGGTAVGVLVGPEVIKSIPLPVDDGALVRPPATMGAGVTTPPTVLEVGAAEPGVPAGAFVEPTTGDGVLPVLAAPEHPQVSVATSSSLNTASPSASPTNENSNSAGV